jgi:lysophospholipase L1-like esterase
MARSASLRAGSQGGPDVVVTVVRGHTQEGHQVFKWGEESGRISVGSRGDWSIAGPGVVPLHLWLEFDGQTLHAAAGDGTAQVQGRPLGEGWQPLKPGAELRFGFALLRVGHEAPRTSASGKTRPLATRLIAAIAGGIVFTALAVALVLAKVGASPQAARPEASALATPSGEPTKVAEPSPPAPSPPTEPAPRSAPSPPAVPAPTAHPPPIDPNDAPVALADGTDTPSTSFKPPAAYPQNVANRPVPRIGDKPWLISEEWRAHHERQLHALGRANAKLVFLGDSITEGWSVAPAYKEQFGKYSPLNLGIANDTTQNVLWRLEHGALDGTHAKVVVLLIGINNLAGGFTAEQTADGVRAIVASIEAHAPAARVLLLAVFPARQEPSNPLRQTIKDANRLLSGLAKPGRVEFHDLGSVLLESDGSISKSTMRDFIHPTADGFARVSPALLPFIDALMARGAE